LPDARRLPSVTSSNVTRPPADETPVRTVAAAAAHAGHIASSLEKSSPCLVVERLYLNDGRRWPLSTAESGLKLDGYVGVDLKRESGLGNYA
jgi:hypothetical protein